ncbi:class I SAM-dependent methyltransferase [Asticcacaulis excentricus]|uniref:Methyltransferase type 11 n=1 Tax=Asticcacaulis excentricus (strain ATCC 15261 / DSM 4724 / KCTC 12464 / NCIMB 9791 / VKM B-1370 / CB 48) TaxID=573065 RepID=E8RS02_ASTEC|nr:class I SAM-dependent methyltransferase [Asticcacaulis excentricus]ADU13527.1 Methyltransferase type 11 [Asticcacaulis excentricus CB 48]
MTPQPDYASITRADPNPFKRYLQRKRFDDAIALLRGRRPALSIDYGAGDGELARKLCQACPDGEVICFEPSAQLRAQAEAHVGALSGVTVVAGIEGIPAARADAIFCLEVFEHLPPEETEAALAQMHRLLKPDGVLIVGVPVETGPVSWVKGWFRGRRRADFDTDRDRIAQAARGDIRFERERVDFEGGGGYYPHHLGFDYRDLLARVKAHFVIETRRSSPLALLPPEWNSELNLLLRKRN